MTSVQVLYHLRVGFHIRCVGRSRHITRMEEVEEENLILYEVGAICFC